MKPTSSAGGISPEEAGARLRQARRILLVAADSSLAEMLAATPVLSNLSRALPEAQLEFLAGATCADAVLDHPNLIRVHTLPGPGLFARLRRARLTRRARRDPIDAALHLSLCPPGAKDLALVRGLGPGFTAGLDAAAEGASPAILPYDCVIPLAEDSRPHMVDRHLALLEGLGIPVVEREHRLTVTSEQRDRARELLLQAGLDPGRPILGAHPGGAPRRLEQQWPPSHYATILQRAGREEGYQTVLLGTREDLPTLDAIQALGKHPIPRLLDLPFALYKAVLSSLQYFLTQDGDPIGVAAGVGVRSFFIFISTPAWKWAPYGAHVSVWEEGARPPGPAEAWGRIRPQLAEAALSAGS